MPLKRLILLYFSLSLLPASTGGAAFSDPFSVTARRYGLNKSMLVGIARAETGHLRGKRRERAVSRSGALGVMQILPSTAAWMCQEKKSELFNKIKNIDCAGRYLRWLRRYCKTEKCLVGSYRHGHRGYKRHGWRKDRAYWRRYNNN